MANDIWELATKIREEANRFESTICDTNGETEGIEADIKCYIEEVKNEMNIN